MNKDDARDEQSGMSVPVLYSIPLPFAYLIAVGLTLAAVGLRSLLDMFGEGIVPFGLFFPVVLASTLLGGRGPGLLALALSLLIGVLYFTGVGPAVFWLILVTLLAALKQRGLKRGVASVCIGGGEATAVAVELY